MQGNTPNLPQRERFAQLLIDLNPNITTADRDALREAGIGSRTTISKYLNGKGTDPDLAVKIIGIVKPRIEAREKELTAA